MTNEQCWKVIDLAHTSTGGETRKQAEVIARHLATRPVADIVAFQRWLLTKMREANRTNFFTAVHWIKAANGMPDVSGDSWEYVRAWVVGRGRRAFEASLANPDAVVEVFTTYEDFCAGEAIKIAAHSAYEMATGSRDSPDEMYKPNVVETMPPAAPDEEETLEWLVAHFPRLVKRFGPPRLKIRRRRG
jgi:Protein of unknown function (DUF4240)